jgi:hypothetical protein
MLFGGMHLAHKQQVYKAKKAHKALITTQRNFFLGQRTPQHSSASGDLSIMTTTSNQLPTTAFIS